MRFRPVALILLGWSVRGLVESFLPEWVQPVVTLGLLAVLIAYKVRTGSGSLQETQP